ncbi:hypothetical protein GBK02_06155 [Dechloromonas sp. TW-R-39-2]|uniref:hypothetical protein n=1 Tax=Dechloromonas sp. TW-R-39-2 TaxID=2654218 RepID=UPI00193DDE57|nr:hypothetical protein [Dechloromonas sp. TW-R-39-2]QRM19003.1 hypothetical protein GBK02_06155 [Dechloromonas sp. TW-R-39-2]
MSNDPILLALYLCSGSKPFPLNSLHRVIWLNKAENLITLIRIDKKPFSKPQTLAYSKVRDWISDKQLILVEKEEAAPQLRLSDVQLAARYPPSNRREKKGYTTTHKLSAPLEYRQKWLKFLDEIIGQLDGAWKGITSLSSILKPACEKHDVCLNDSYQVVYAFYANKCSRLSVIPERFRSGAFGKPRVGKGHVLGRMTTKAKLEGKGNTNFGLDENWLQKIRDTYQESIKHGVTGPAAYETFLNLYCLISVEMINGELETTYLPQGQRPSEAQFLAHGPNDDPEQALWRKQLLDQEYEKNNRPLNGQSNPITLQTGLRALVDASSNDRYLVSAFNRSQTLGPARVIPVVEEKTGYIWGIYVGWRVNKEAAKLSILNACSDKVEFCARYHIHIKPEEWYSHLHAEFRADKGEFNCTAVRESLGETNRSIEYVITGRPDLRGRGERAHGLLHDHNANGSTFGRFRKRGEIDPAKEADQTLFDFTRELIRDVLRINNFDPVPHLRTTEMIQAGVEPYRRNILEYCMANGYHHQISYNEDDLYLALCPEFPASITRDGIYPLVKRHFDSGDEILLKDLRYLGQNAEFDRWLESARRNKRERISILMNPNDPRVAYFQDPDNGLQRLRLATKDPLLASLASVHDLTIRATEDTVMLYKANNRATENSASKALQNSAERKEIAKQKTADVKRHGGRKGASSNASGRRKALQDEVRTHGQSPIPISPTKHQTSVQPENQTSSSNVVPLRGPPSSDIDKDFERWLNGDPE